MAQPPTRSLIGAVIKNFINSLRPRQIRGNLMGTDYFGNKFFEIPANPSLGKRKASRWFEPLEKDAFDQEMSPEWEAWLRGRRTEAPLMEEVLKNVAIMEMKKKNALVVDAKAGQMTPMKKGPETFPKWNEYEISPGKPQGSK